MRARPGSSYVIPLSVAKPLFVFSLLAARDQAKPEASILDKLPGINPFIKRMQTLRVLVRWVPRCTKPGENNQLGSYVVLMMFDVGK